MSAPHRGYVAKNGRGELCYFPYVKGRHPAQVSGIPLVGRALVHAQKAEEREAPAARPSADDPYDKRRETIAKLIFVAEHSSPGAAATFYRGEWEPFAADTARMKWGALAEERKARYLALVDVILDAIMVG